MKQFFTLAIILLLFTGAAHAATTASAVASIELTSGGFSIDLVGGMDFIEFPEVDLNEQTGGITDLPASSAPVFRLTNLDGSGAPWYVTFETQGKLTSDGDRQLADIEYSGRPDIIQVSGHSLDLPEAEEIYDETVLTNSAIPVLACAEGRGMGIYDLRAKATANNGNYYIDIPSNGLEGTYHATMTATICKGTP